MSSSQRYTLLYDGSCGLCHRSVRYLLRHDKRHVFDFATLQGGLATELLREHGVESPRMDTVFVVARSDDGSTFIYRRSKAVFFCLGVVGGGWSWVRVFRFLPRLVTDGVYRLVSRVRYRIFGRDKSCPIPSAQHRDRFLDGDPLPEKEDQ